MIRFTRYLLGVYVLIIIIGVMFISVVSLSIPLSTGLNKPSALNSSVWNIVIYITY